MAEVQKRDDNVRYHYVTTRQSGYNTTLQERLYVDVDPKMMSFNNYLAHTSQRIHFRPHRTTLRSLTSTNSASYRNAFLSARTASHGLNDSITQSINYSLNDAKRASFILYRQTTRDDIRIVAGVAG